eukprot:gb/GECH01012925.1/.p1 GENE.gb/GECH01012925.1/~~gb/GECH01012925.1/.p1  ORF type:complete len:244 (+),score=36.49 gb/GECH01012925.1/:1-732(+)
MISNLIMKLSSFSKLNLIFLFVTLLFLKFKTTLAFTNEILEANTMIKVVTQRDLKTTTHKYVQVNLYNYKDCNPKTSYLSGQFISDKCLTGLECTSNGEIVQYSCNSDCSQCTTSDRYQANKCYAHSVMGPFPSTLSCSMEFNPGFDRVGSLTQIQYHKGCNDEGVAVGSTSVPLGCVSIPSGFSHNTTCSTSSAVGRISECQGSRCRHCDHSTEYPIGRCQKDSHDGLYKTAVCTPPRNKIN